MGKPIIGVTGPDEGGYAAWFFTRIAIWRAGGKAVRITPSKSAAGQELNGLILGGGADIQPERYGSTTEALLELRRTHLRFPSERRRPASGLAAPLIFLFRRFVGKATREIDPDRDELEQTLLEEATREGVPVLGICRGCQFINVHAGGSLHGDISDFYTEEPNPSTVYPRKQVFVEPETRLASIIGPGAARVNSLHKQAVDRIGIGVEVAAREGNGVVQAIEGSGDHFLLGVQWHPEYLPQIRRQQRLFRALVEAATRFRTGA